MPNSYSIAILLKTFLFFFRVISDKDNVIMIGDNPRQFRMKLPEKEFSAFVAVGLR
jgi:hypothetical protein